MAGHGRARIWLATELGQAVYIVELPRYPTWGCNVAQAPPLSCITFSTFINDSSHLSPWMEGGREGEMRVCQNHMCNINCFGGISSHYHTLLLPVMPFFAANVIMLPSYGSLVCRKLYIGMAQDQSGQQFSWHSSILLLPLSSRRRLLRTRGSPHGTNQIRLPKTPLFSFFVSFFLSLPRAKHRPLNTCETKHLPKIPHPAVPSDEHRASDGAAPAFTSHACKLSIESHLCHCSRRQLLALHNHH